MQNNVVKRKDLSEWEREYGGTTADGVARRVINKYRPSAEDLVRTVNRGRGAGRAEGAGGEEGQAMDIAAEAGESHR